MAGIRDGLEQWSAVNDIKFTYTDSRLDANIIVQQQTGNGNAFGNAVVGCLFYNNQCTIQLFTHLDVPNHDENLEVLVNRQSTEFTIAHEFGHLIGLPHHIDPDHVMNTVHANNVRTYYESRGVNVPSMIEPEITEQILLRVWDYVDVEYVTPHTTDKTTIKDTPTRDNTPPESYEDNSQIWTADDILEHEVVIEFINVMKVTLSNIPIEERFQAFLEISNIIFGSTILSGLLEGEDNIAPNRATVLNREGTSVPGCEKTNDCFIPSTVTIDIGGEVVWKNVDNAAHTVTSGVLADGGPDGIFDSGLFTPDAEFSHVFDTPGEYPYFCLVHPWSTGMVIVLD